MSVKAEALFRRLSCLGLAAMLLAQAVAWAQFEVNPPLWHDPMGFSRSSPEAQAALAQGAQIIELPAEGSFALAWFPPDYRGQIPRRLLYVLHGDGSEGQTGNAYEALLKSLPMAKKYGYGLVSLQWRRTGDMFMDARDVQRVLANMLPSLVARYGVFPNRVGLETAGRSAELSYEVAYWDKLSKRNLFRLIIAQSGGVSAENPRPIPARLLAEVEALAQAVSESAGKAPLQPAGQAKMGLQAKPPVALASAKPIALGKPVPVKPAAGKPPAKAPSPPPYPPGKALEGARFFLYCSRQPAHADLQVCDGMQVARRIIEGQAGQVVGFVEAAPDDGAAALDLYGNPANAEAAVQTFLLLTAGPR